MLNTHSARADAGAPPPDANGNGTTAGQRTLSGSAQIDGLLYGITGFTNYWTGAVSYSFPDASGDYGAYTSDDDEDGTSAQNEGFSQFSLTQQNAARFVLEADDVVASRGFSVEGFTNLVVSQAADVAGGNATMRLANSSDAETAYAYRPSAAVQGGDSFYGTDASVRSPVAGSYGWHTTIHEIGHALGLKHGHAPDTFANNPAVLPSNLDSMEYSVMTYRSYVGGPLSGYTNESFGYAQSFMMLDIQALQYLYGADFTTNSGNTTYKWNPTSGNTLIDGVAAIEPGGNKIFATLWDGGGTDTYDLSSYTTAVNVSLEAGSFSIFSDAQRASLGNGNTARGNIFNALQYNGDARSLIENATGGSAGDTLRGNQAANVLIGNGGIDTLYGLAGADYLYGGEAGDTLFGGTEQDMLFGGAGGDTHDGGAGVDYARYDDGTYGNLLVSLAQPSRNTGVAFGDSYVDIEGLILGSGNDYVFGNGLDNYLIGQGGNDNLFGGVGADRLHGGAGLDYARYDDADYGNLVVSLGVPSRNTGAATGDTYVEIEGVIGGSGGDYLYGDGLDNYLVGLTGNDMLFGGLGRDSLNGGVGFDYARYDDAAYAGLVVSLATPSTNTGAALGDTFVDVEGLILTNNSDSGTGNSLANYIYGQGGSDTLNGREGRDNLFGGTQVGVVDTFVFNVAAVAANADVIHDFQRGFDQIALVSAIYGNNEANIFFNAAANNVMWRGANPASAADDVVIATLIGVTQFTNADYYFI